jgi:hypothetical protein
MNNYVLQSLGEGVHGVSMALMHVPKIRLEKGKWLPTWQIFLAANVSGEQK